MCVTPSLVAFTFPLVAGEHLLLLHLFLQLSRNEYHDVQTSDQSCQRLAINKSVANGRHQPCRANGSEGHHRCLSSLVIWARRRPHAVARSYSILERVFLPARAWNHERESLHHWWRQPEHRVHVASLHRSNIYSKRMDCCSGVHAGFPHNSRQWLCRKDASNPRRQPRTGRREPST